MNFNLGEFLESLGIDYKYLINGLIGGIVWSLYKKSKFLEALRQVIIGCLVAGYVTPLIGHTYSTQIQFLASLSFIVGMMGMVIIDSVYKFIVNKIKAFKIGELAMMKKDSEITKND